MLGTVIALIIYAVLLRLGVYEPARSMQNGLRWYHPTLIVITGFFAYVVLLAGAVPLMDTEDTQNAVSVFFASLIPTGIALYLGWRAP